MSFVRREDPAVNRLLLGLGGLLALALGVYVLALKSELRHAGKERARYEELYRGATRARLLTIANYREASALASAAAMANKLKLEADGRRVAAQVGADYEKRIAGVRAVAGRMREDRAARSNSGSSPGAGLSGAGDAAARVDDPAKGAGLSFDQRLVATEQAIQLDALQQFVRGTTGVQ